jgi:hypothetical protein
MAILKSESYIATNPRFELTEPGSRPKLQKGETTIVYECFETLGPSLSLRELVRHCGEPEYRERFTNPRTDIDQIRPLPPRSSGRGHDK